MLNSKGLLLIAFLFMLFIFGRIYGDSNSVIKWEPVYGAGGYIVEIVDSDNNTVIKRETKDNSIDVGNLTPGIYKYRITTLNKLKQEGGNTGWLALTIKKEDIIKDVASDLPKDESIEEGDVAASSSKDESIEEDVATDSSKDVEKDSAGEYFKMYFVIGLGWEYNIPLASWSNKLNNSYKGLNLYISFPLAVIKPVRDIPFISSLGVDVQFSYAQYSLAKDRVDTRFLYDQSYLIGGFHAGLNYPISLDSVFPKTQLILNIDPGLSYSKYSRKLFGEKYETTSYDFSFITGATVRYFWTDCFFTDFSAQYYRISYQSNPYNNLKLILRLGVFL
ncbi:MAG: hypothetical protein FWH53_02440 [Leptospirales bacterium]|nr:hypothetical protein [Leptospirales bacterium]